MAPAAAAPTEASTPLAGAIDRRIEAFQAGSGRIGVIGLGYVGLPLAALLAERGFQVIGFDVDPEKVAILSRAESYIHHIPGARLAPLIAGGQFSATADFDGLRNVDAILICVPTPLTRQREPDLSFVVGTAETILPRLRRGQLIILESTTYPGTTRDVLKPILERSGLTAEQDFFLAYSPEREDPGNTGFTTASIPKVVGGGSVAARRLAEALYRRIVPMVVSASSLETAEAVKLTENIFRSVNIALVNELKVLFDAMGIDIWEVIEAAKTKPFGYMPFYPGPGLGGHCIPIDPFYLTWKAREYSIATRFIELAGEINTAMPRYVVARLAESLNQRFGRSFKGARILILGVAYKKNVDDVRESPAFAIMELLEAQGAEIVFHDPYVDVLPPMRHHPRLAGRAGVLLTAETVAANDAVVICTDHDGVDYTLVVDAARLVIDTRNACARAGTALDKVVKA